MAKTPVIKFSHAYNKLLIDGRRLAVKVVLLQVVTIHIDQLSKPFIDYDTDNGTYKLEHQTTYLMLIFQKAKGDIFTTLRPQWNRFGNKLDYYQGLVGKEFNVEVMSYSVPEGKEVSHA